MKVIFDEEIGRSPATNTRDEVPLYISDHMGLQVDLKFDGASSAFLRSMHHIPTGASQISAVGSSSIINDQNPMRAVKRARTEMEESALQSSATSSIAATISVACMSSSSSGPKGDLANSQREVLSVLLGNEPSGDLSSTVVIGLRTAKGSRRVRRFKSDDPLAALFVWAAIISESTDEVVGGDFDIRFADDNTLLGHSRDQNMDRTLLAVKDIERRLLKITYI